MSHPANILIVDDDPAVCSATARALKPGGFETATAADGLEALARAKEKKPDLILLDVNMPVMDGIETLRRIKADPELSSICVLIVSGSRTDTDSQAHGLETGADGYITRPIPNRELLARVQAMLRIKAAEEETRRLNQTLEAQVEERTRQLREAQDKLLRQERLAVLGQLAGSVGHELRNPLGVVHNAVYFLTLIQPDAPEKVKEYLGIIQSEVHTADKIINDLLHFGRSKSVVFETVAPARLAEEALSRFAPPEGIRLIRDEEPDLPSLSVDLQQITQALGNLLVNAYQSMPAGGEITLSVRREGDGRVAVAVRDEGAGIPPENMARLFEPLFTTKPRGIGLGLAVSRKLVEANGGRLEVQSEAGRGSVFTILLPVQPS